MNDDTFEPIIGLEIHVELKTASKMFCGCKNDPFFAGAPNIYTCPVCLGLPGALPVPNRRAVEWTVLLGLALGCEIPELSKFDRKNYFYPDLPKGYQISQYDQPLAVNGRLEVNYQRTTNLSAQAGNKQPSERTIRIRRVHLEEDTGKLLHATVDSPTSPSGLRGAGKKVTLIDFNRSGVPLVEIVTEPDIRSAEEAKVFLKKLHQIIRYLDISDADMEKGSMRLEPNVSVRKKENGKRKKTDALPDYKVEVKNINSFRFAERAIDFEIRRHIGLLKQGETPVQETRGWNEGKGETVSQRRKEEADDYRYFPEPDIPPMRFTKNQIAQIKNQIGELPDAKTERFVTQYGLSGYDANILTETRALAGYFEECVRVAQKTKEHDITPKKIANWMINRQIDLDEVMPAAFVERIVAATHQVAIPEEELDRAIADTIAENRKAVSDYREGKEQAVMFLMGQIQRKLKGKGTPDAILAKLKEVLR